jgi:hypothetical protein
VNLSLVVPSRRFRPTSFCLRVFVSCLRNARRHPLSADILYRGAYHWLSERVRLEGVR